jgi:hypothetical protein
MTKSGQNKGSTKTKFSEFNETWTQNHVEWLVEKFGGYVGEIKANDVRKKGSSEISYEKYRELLELAVKSRRAYSNGRLASHNKYAIYFNSGNSLFDDELLLDIRITSLPPESCQIRTVDGEKLKRWHETKAYWTYVYKLLCGSQKEGKVDLNILPNYLDRHTKKSLKLNTRLHVCIYKALKFGWNEMPRCFELYGDNYNVFFLDILRRSSINMLSTKLSGFKPYSSGYRDEYLHELHQELKDRSQPSDKSLLDREKQDELIRKIFGENFNSIERSVIESINQITEIHLALQKMLETSNDPALHQILSEWKAVNEECIKARFSQLRHQKDKTGRGTRDAKSMKKAWV